MSDAVRVLFVCTGSACRSVTAQHIFSHELEKVGLAKAFELQAAGQVAKYGAHNSQAINSELPRLGYPAITGQAIELETDLVEAADLILTAGERQRGGIVRAVPQALNKTLTLKQLARVATAVHQGIKGVPPMPAADLPDARQQRLAHLLKYRGYAPYVDLDHVEDIADPAESGLYRESITEIQQAVTAIVRWWAR